MTFWQQVVVRWALVKATYKLGRQLTPQEIFDIGMNAVGADRLQYTTIGMLTVAWAEVEFYLDIINGILILHKNVEDRQLPVALKNKIRFLRKCFDRIPELAPHRATQTIVLSDVERLSIIRHDIVHGVAFVRLPAAARQISRLKYQGKDLDLQQATYNAGQIVDAANELSALGDKLSVLFWNVHGVIAPIVAPHTIQ